MLSNKAPFSFTLARSHKVLADGLQIQQHKLRTSFQPQKLRSCAHARVRVRVRTSQCFCHVYKVTYS
jgi:hypothetical protein